jgi:hypothetical protein
MSRYWQHTLYAEDQPYSHAILTTHVLTRALQTGSLVGTAVGTSLFLLRRFNILKPRILPLTFTTTLLRSTGVGAVIGTGLLAVGLPLLMRGKEEIEWQDRSWRLLENKGQVEVDNWTYGGMAAGLAVSVARANSLGWRGAIGSVGAGSLLGMMGYMGWRHGIKGGKWDEKDV